mmetsp:Transcript_49602/g.68871  ORF Transcript_49602/g.68871 Transcript_49602/m.68871 type:complete len:215 (-) Transcript_49602:151-795(-)
MPSVSTCNSASSASTATVGLVAVLLVVQIATAWITTVPGATKTDVAEELTTHVLRLVVTMPTVTKVPPTSARNVSVANVVQTVEQHVERTPTVQAHPAARNVSQEFAQRILKDVVAPARSTLIATKEVFAVCASWVSVVLVVPCPVERTPNVWIKTALSAMPPRNAHTPPAVRHVDKAVWSTVTALGTQQIAGTVYMANVVQLVETHALRVPSV